MTRQRDARAGREVSELRAEATWHCPWCGWSNNSTKIRDPERLHMLICPVLGP